MLDLPFNAQSFLKAGIFPDKKSLIRASLRALWQTNPGVRVDMAVYQYQNEPISITKAAALAGVSFDQMKDVLNQRGVPLRIGNESADEILEDFHGLQESL